jgi:hypothetical protein
VSDYRVKKSDKIYEVHEGETDQVVARFKKEKSAKAMARDWNLGGGFSGWTPSFFLIGENIFSDYNQSKS